MILDWDDNEAVIKFRVEYIMETNFCYKLMDYIATIN